MDIISYSLAKKAYDAAKQFDASRLTNTEINLIKTNFKFNTLMKSSKYNLGNMVIDTLEDNSGFDLQQTTAAIANGILTRLVMLNLSGGTGDGVGQTVYTAPNGVIVTSSAPIYGTANNYYMSHLFNNTITVVSPDQHVTYWLTSSTGNQTLTFDFNAIGNPMITYIDVYPRTRDDASSNYRILVSDDGINWIEKVPWVTVNTSTPYGTKNTHNLNTATRYVRFELTRNRRWGVTLSEIQFYLGGGGVAITKPDTINISGLLFIAEYEGDVQFYISIDDGATWAQIYNEQLIKLSANSVRFKFVLPNGGDILYSYGYLYN